MSETLGAHSTAAVRSAPNLAQLSAAAVPLGSPGGDGTEGSEPSGRPPAAFVRGGRRCRHKAGGRTRGGALGAPRRPRREPPRPYPAPSPRRERRADRGAADRARPAT